MTIATIIKSSVRLIFSLFSIGSFFIFRVAPADAALIAFSVRGLLYPIVYVSQAVKIRDDFSRIC
jgi:hypothetical protein